MTERYSPHAKRLAAELRASAEANIASGRYGISDAEARLFRAQPRVKRWNEAYGSPMGVLDGMVSHEWPSSQDGQHDPSPKCQCRPFYAGMVGRMQFWYHENPMVGVRPRTGALPVARWVEGSEVLHTSWGLTMKHAKRRAARWGAKNRSHDV